MRLLVHFFFVLLVENAFLGEDKDFVTPTHFYGGHQKREILDKELPESYHILCAESFSVRLEFGPNMLHCKKLHSPCFTIT